MRGIAILSPPIVHLEAQLIQFSREHNYGLVLHSRAINHPDTNTPTGARIDMRRKEKMYIGDALLLDYIKDKLTAHQHTDKKIVFHKIPSSVRQLNALLEFVDLELLIAVQQPSLQDGSKRSDAMKRYQTRSRMVISHFDPSKTYIIDQHDPDIILDEINRIHENFYK